MERETKLTGGNKTANGNQNVKPQSEWGTANSELQQESSSIHEHRISNREQLRKRIAEILRSSQLMGKGLTSGIKLAEALYCTDVSQIDIMEEALTDAAASIENSETIFWGVTNSATMSQAYEISDQRMSALNDIMEALTDAGASVIGVYGTETATMADLIEKVSRRAYRDNLFDKVIRVSITSKIELKRIQGEVAAALGFTMTEKSEANRAAVLRDRIKMEQKILVVLQGVNKGLDLAKLGIPFGDDNTGCKLLLTSTSQEILSNHMQAHKVIRA